MVERFQGTPLFLCCYNTMSRNICMLKNVIIFFNIKSLAFIKKSYLLGASNVFLHGKKADISEGNVINCVE